MVWWIDRHRQTDTLTESTSLQIREQIIGFSHSILALVPHGLIWREPDAIWSVHAVALNHRWFMRLRTLKRWLAHGLILKDHSAGMQRIFSSGWRSPLPSPHQRANEWLLARKVYKSLWSNIQPLTFRTCLLFNHLSLKFCQLFAQKTQIVQYHEIFM